ncbi:FliO/MopB family protein [Aestuariispira insulae]|uniref:Flagellar protein FliO/FliZ n=1 Tax=Aestuariispira insulae TaxID=1461337 RepID=A0A3D9HSP5_9PROT|nr:flagellar biosynthetic protein FliO [Aestuariispira insulae]RED52470.1 flagellar protein FliO/FliZ [Aestuariispira insulae]
MNEVVGTADYFRFLLALILVIGLIGICAVILRKYGLRLAGPQARGGKRRLSVEEILPVDARHRLVLVRQDDQEHLILIGAGNSQLIHSGIKVAQSQESDDPAEKPRQDHPEKPITTGTLSRFQNLLVRNGQEKSDSD